MTDDEQAIRAVIETWMRASEAGDVQTVLGLMDEDVAFMVPGAEPFGRDRFAEAAKVMKGTSLRTRSDIRELRVMGDWAYVRNHIEVTMTPPGGPSKTRAGYTLTIFRKKPDRRWVLSRDANLMAEGMGPES